MEGFCMLGLALERWGLSKARAPENEVSLQLRVATRSIRRRGGRER